jgi:ribose 5-phosphate isomerase RpiB
MRIAVGADHAGTPLNEVAIAELRSLGHEVVDFGGRTILRNPTTIPTMRLRLQRN